MQVLWIRTLQPAPWCGAAEATADRARTAVGHPQNCCHLEDSLPVEIEPCSGIYCELYIARCWLLLQDCTNCSTIEHYNHWRNWWHRNWIWWLPFVRMSTSALSWRSWTCTESRVNSDAALKKRNFRSNIDRIIHVMTSNTNYLNHTVNNWNFTALHK